MQKDIDQFWAEFVNRSLEENLEATGLFLEDPGLKYGESTLIKRTLLYAIYKDLDIPEITIILGPRQAGKTTLMTLYARFLEEQNIKSIYLNYDIEPHRMHIDSYNNLLAKAQLEFGNQKGVVFLDEIQHKEKAGIFLKGLYDAGFPYKVIATGSSSLELKYNVQESLVGRKRIHFLNTVSWQEFVNFKTAYKYENKLLQYLKVEQLNYRNLLLEYMQYGGYPRVTVSDSVSEKVQALNDIVQSYVYKDISFLGIEKSNAFLDLLKYLAIETGQITNLHNLSSLIGISLATLKKYLYFAEETFVLYKVPAFVRRVSREISRMPVYYFWDLGLRNFLSGSINKQLGIKELSFLFQNVVFLELLQLRFKHFFQIKYWRTKSGAEVDFILENGNTIIPVEVKFKGLQALFFSRDMHERPSKKLQNSLNITRSLASFIKIYAPKLAFVVTFNVEGAKQVGKTTVYYVPFFKFKNTVEKLLFN